MRRNRLQLDFFPKSSPFSRRHSVRRWRASGSHKAPISSEVNSHPWLIVEEIDTAFVACCNGDETLIPGVDGCHWLWTLHSSGCGKILGTLNLICMFIQVTEGGSGGTRKRRTLSGKDEGRVFSKTRNSANLSITVGDVASTTGSISRKRELSFKDFPGYLVFVSSFETNQSFVQSVALLTLQQRMSRCRFFRRWTGEAQRQRLVSRGRSMLCRYDSLLIVVSVNLYR